MKNAIQDKARELGFNACRFTTAQAPDHASRFQSWIEAQHHGEMGYLQRNAHKRVNPQLVLSEAKTIISLAVSYGESATEISKTCVPQTRDKPLSGTIARYARFSDYHDVIGDQLKVLVEFVQQLDPRSRSLWYVDTGPLLERDLAQRAGLGFIGKHTNLISRALGNWFFLSEIITTIELEPDLPEKNRCGSCIRCIDACPTRAITAPFQLDARRCISYLTIELKGSIPIEFRSAIGNRIYGCDDCLDACPWNRFAQAAKMMKPFGRAELAEPDLISLLELDEAQFRAKFSKTPILRTKRRGLLRNVCVALGNVGGVEALPALERASTDLEPLIAEHAKWAILEIQRRLAAGSIPSLAEN